MTSSSPTSSSSSSSSSPSSSSLSPTNTNKNNNNQTSDTTANTLTSIHPEGEAHRISPADVKLYEDIVNASDEYPYMLDAVNRLATSISQYKLEHCALSFNGGKDCTVLLHLLRAALAHLHLHISDLTVLYFKVDNEFPEIEEFMYECCQRYNLHLTTVEGNFSDALHLIFSERKSGHLPPIDAIFMGQRRHDPYCMTLDIESASDEAEGWPPFHRINVLLDWTYGQIWRFLRLFHLPYCKLYDQGYTSIGNTLDSVPNPLLYHPLTQSYKAAYELKDDSTERCGRKEKDRTPNHKTSNGVGMNGVNS